MGNSVVEKSVITKYVHDAMELEAALFTLDQAISGCESRKDELKKQIEEKEGKEQAVVGGYAQRLSWHSDTLRNAKKDKEDKIDTHPKFDWINFFSCFFGFFIFFGIVVLVISFIVSLFSGVFSFPTVLIISSVIGLIAGGIGAVPEYIKGWIERNKSISRLEVEIQKAEKGYKQAKSAWETATAQSVARFIEVEMKAENETRLLNDQIDDLSSKRRILRSNLDRFYAYGIVPPDYRYFDCVTILDQIFRNDLADTIRAAILLYEDRVFKGEVIRGMDKICQKLDSLSDGMRAVVGQLRSINASVDGMRSDLNRRNREFMDKQETWMSELRRSNEALVNESRRSQALSAELLKESQIGRFTNEKLLESSKRLEYYAQEYRMGRMPRDYMN